MSSIKDNDIADMDRAHRAAVMRAIRSTGWRRRVHMAFARLFSCAGDLGRKIKRDDQRGKDDIYHDEY